MRFKIELNALDKKIPIGNRFMICSLIKRAISDGDTELFNSIYKYEDKKNKKIKDFTFSTVNTAFLEQSSITPFFEKYTDSLFVFQVSSG